MRPLCVTLNFTEAWGGTTVSVTNFMNALDAPVISFTFESLIAGAKHGDNIHHVPVPDTPAGRLYSRPRTKELREAIEIAKDHDVIFCHMLFRFHNDWVAGLQKPYFIVPHGSLDPYVFTYRKYRKELWLKLSGARFFRNASSVIFATHREQEKAHISIASARSTVIGWPVQEDDGSGPSRQMVRDQLGIKDDEKMLLFVGRLHPMKRPMETIEAFARASAKGTHLVMVGPGEHYKVPELVNAARSYGANNVHVTGPLFGGQKWAMYRAADGYISLSARENFGYTAAEAMREGLPLILSRGNDLGHEVAGERCAWHLPSDDREEAVKAIREFAQAERETLTQMGKRGRNWIGANATFKTFKSGVCALASRAV